MADVTDERKCTVVVYRKDHGDWQMEKDHWRRIGRWKTRKKIIGDGLADAKIGVWGNTNIDKFISKKLPAVRRKICLCKKWHLGKK